MDFENMKLEELEARKAELLSQLDSADTNEAIDTIEEELRKIDERRAELRRRAEEETAKAEKREAVARGEGELIVEKLIPQEDRTMETTNTVEVRNTEAYIDAFAKGVKSGNYSECRTLLSTGVEGGTVAIPDFVADIIKTAWDKEMIMSRIPEMSFDGDLEIQFEISGTDAVIHIEGSGAVAEEELVLGIATIKMDSIKKWISISKKVMKLRGRSFLEYIYKELAHKIAKKAADVFVGAVAALPAVPTATTPSAAVVTEAPGITTILKAISELSDEANNPVIIMNKRSKVAFVDAARAANYASDIFEGCEILYNNSLPAYGSATAGQVYAIVGDLEQGAIKTKPTEENDEPEFIFDEITRKKENLVEVLGEQMRGVGVIADKAFTLIKKPTSV